MALIKNLILRKPRGDRLEGRTSLIQLRMGSSNGMTTRRPRSSAITA